tara:strand:+ start:17803 stop:18507 length:705 start_codon:yes stop_codon:yes gene_type:complete
MPAFNPDLHSVPPYCRPFRCSDIYNYINLVPSLSYVNTGFNNIDPATGTVPVADSIKDGFDKVNSNFKKVTEVLQHFGNVYGKYRQNIALTYTISSLNPDTVTIQPPQVGDVLYFSPSSTRFPDGCWSYALATSGYASEALGVISNIVCPHGAPNLSGACFTITLNGYVSSGDLPARIPGTTYFLSMYVSGGTSTSNPTSPNYVSKPIYTAISNNEIIVDIKRGALIANFTEWP